MINHCIKLVPALCELFFCLVYEHELSFCSLAGENKQSAEAFQCFSAVSVETKMNFIWNEVICSWVTNVAVFPDVIELQSQYLRVSVGNQWNCCVSFFVCYFLMKIIISKSHAGLSSCEFVSKALLLAYLSVKAKGNSQSRFDFILYG